MITETDYLKAKKLVADYELSNGIKPVVSGSLLAPTLDKRLAFAEELIAKIDGDMPVSAILATTYWMQAEMMNLNSNDR